MHINIFQQNTQEGSIQIHEKNFIETSQCKGYLGSINSYNILICLIVMCTLCRLFYFLSHLVMTPCNILGTPIIYVTLMIH